MTQDQLIQNWLMSSEKLSERLAKYDGLPAIFREVTPDDQQAGWCGRSQYPRICYRKDMQTNQERSAAGTLYLVIYTDTQSAEIFELERICKRHLQDVIMKASGEAPFSLAWASEESFNLEGTNVYGKELVFDIHEYPRHMTTDPDPEQALAYFIKALYPEAVVLGIDQVGDYTDAESQPVFYIELTTISQTTGHCSNSIVWFNTQLSVHLLHPDARVRMRMIAAVEQALAENGEIIMIDQSPMEIRGLEMNNKSDYVKEGQLTVSGKYGVLRSIEKKHGLSFEIGY